MKLAGIRFDPPLDVDGEETRLVLLSISPSGEAGWAILETEHTIDGHTYTTNLTVDVGATLIREEGLNDKSPSS